MASAKFHFVPSGKDLVHEGRLFIRLIHKRKIKNIRTEYRIFPHEWDTLNRTVVFPNDSPERTHYLKEIGKRMDRDMENLRGIIARLRAAKPEFGVEDITGLFGPDSSRAPKSLAAYCRTLTDELYRNGQERTGRAYLSTIRRFLNFIGKPEIALEEIDSTLTGEFERHLTANGLRMNTISFYMRNLRVIYNRAVEEEIIAAKPQKPFKRVFTGIHETRKRAPGKSELIALVDLAPKLDAEIQRCGHDTEAAERKKYVRIKESLYYFLFCFHARGMSFVDMAYLRKSNIQDHTLRYRRKKTGGYFEIKITRPMERILRYFEDKDPGAEYLFPVIRKTDGTERAQYENGLRLQNLHLNALGKMAGLPKKLTTHVARHTYATLAKRENIPIAVISEALGHKDIHTTNKYLDSLERSTLDRLSDFMSGLVMENTGKEKLLRNGISVT